MALWLTKKASITEWGAIQFRLTLMQQEMQSSLHLAMLVKRGSLDHSDDVFVLLPDEELKERLTGFVSIDVSEIPSNLRTLIGDVDALGKRFPSLVDKIIPEIRQV